MNSPTRSAKLNLDSKSASAPSELGAVIGYPTLPLHVESEGVGGVLPPVLDACCGTRMMWFDPGDPRALFVDKRRESHVIDIGTPGTIGRKDAVINPDVLADFTELPFPSGSFALVVIDPPHLRRLEARGTLTKKYGVLIPGWEEMLRGAFEECFRVLRPHGVLIFKWCETEIPLDRVLALTEEKPLFGHRSGAKSKTHWVTFLKGGGGGFSSEKPSGAATSDNIQAERP